MYQKNDGISSPSCCFQPLPKLFLHLRLWLRIMLESMWRRNFAIHPANTTTVAWMKSFGDSCVAVTEHFFHWENLGYPGTGWKQQECGEETPSSTGSQWEHAGVLVAPASVRLYCTSKEWMWGGWKRVYNVLLGHLLLNGVMLFWKKSLNHCCNFFDLPLQSFHPTHKWLFISRSSLSGATKVTLEMWRQNFHCEIAHGQFLTTQWAKRMVNARSSLCMPLFCLSPSFNSLMLLLLMIICRGFWPPLQTSDVPMSILITQPISSCFLSDTCLQTKCSICVNQVISFFLGSSMI